MIPAAECRAIEYTLSRLHGRQVNMSDYTIVRGPDGSYEIIVKLQMSEDFAGMTETPTPMQASTTPALPTRPELTWTIGNQTWTLDPDHECFDDNMRRMGRLERALLLAHMDAVREGVQTRHLRGDTGA